jgi:hypothetical protein
MALFTNMSVPVGCREEEINLQKLFLLQLPTNQPFLKLRPPPHIIFGQCAPPKL